MRVLALGIVAVLVAACAPTTLKARMRDAERRAEQAQSSLDEAEKAAQALEPKDMERALKDAKEALLSPNIELYPDASLHTERYKELAARLPQVRSEREKRDLETRLNKARDKLVPLVHRLTEAMDNLDPSNPTKQAINLLDDAADDLKDELEDEQDLFEKDKDFATWAKSHQVKSEKALELVARSKRSLAFITGPGEALTQALKLQKDAKALKKPEEKTGLLEDARTKLEGCEKATVDASIATTPLMIAGKLQTPSQVQALCKATLKSVVAAIPKPKAKAPPAPARKKK